MEYYKNLSLESIFYINDDGLICQEEWKDIPEYEGLYQASNLGRIKSLSRFKKNYSKLQLVNERILKQTKSGKYLTLEINKQSISYTTTVHQLIAITFLNHIPCGFDLVIDHKNNEKLNNCLWNLQIITHRINSTKDRVSKSGIRGVFKTNKKYIAMIAKERKNIYLGVFNTAEEAHKTHKKALDLILQEKSISHLIVRQNRTSKTGVVGVYEERGKFSACIFKKTKKVHIGTFETLEEAKEEREKYITNKN